jgi:DNA-binding transcriptional LysR family regulator
MSFLCADIKLSHIRSFLAVSQHGSITSAAASLKIAQSAVTRQIKLLEKEVGMPLFARTARGVTLTDAGTVFHKSVRLVPAELDEAVQAARRQSTSLRIGAERTRADQAPGKRAVQPVAPFGES